MLSRRELKIKKRQELVLLAKNEIIDQFIGMYEISLQKTDLIIYLESEVKKDGKP